MGKALLGKLSCTHTGLVPLPLIQEWQLSVTAESMGKFVVMQNVFWVV